MQNLYNDLEFKKLNANLLDERVYTSRLLGAEPSLVLHGGGNTSVKIREKNFFNEEEFLLYVKGSGHDLKTIERVGFAGVKMDVLLKMAKLTKLSDTDMVKYQKAAMVNPSMPAPSVEAILHAIIPHTFVDHTHSDAIVCLTNIPNGEEIIKNVLGDRFLYLPYVMPGFILATQVYEFTKNLNWEKYDGIILLHHGIFTFNNSAKKSYDLMIEAVTKAENYIKEKKADKTYEIKYSQTITSIEVANLRHELSTLSQTPMILRPIENDLAFGFCQNEKLISASQRGPLTPDHSINVKRIPMVVGLNRSDAVKNYASEYTQYFNKNKTENLKILDLCPRWAIIQNKAVYSIGMNKKRAEVARDIALHSMKTWNWAENLGGWIALSDKDIFDVEYWELEQAKLKSTSAKPVHEGKIALVTGAASGIGKATVEKLVKDGAVVCALDISPKILEIFTNGEVLPLICDVTDPVQLKTCIEKVVLQFGGLDIVVSNAGTFPKSESLKDLEKQSWQKTIEVNLNSHQYLLHESIQFLELGIDPTFIIIASKNVKAPGPGASAYSSAKAGLTQLARVAALELAEKGVRVNVIHPNAVFDTGIWTDDVLKKRAENYKMSVDEYKKNNLMHVEITSHDVAGLVTSMASNIFSKITGAQINIDGGNDRTI